MRPLLTGLSSAAAGGGTAQPLSAVVRWSDGRPVRWGNGRMVKWGNGAPSNGLTYGGEYLTYAGQYLTFG